MRVFYNKKFYNIYTIKFQKEKKNISVFKDLTLEK